MSAARVLQWPAAAPLPVGDEDARRNAVMESWQFGPAWTYAQIALWIEARANADPPLRRDLIIWASDFMTRRREQEALWRD